MFSERRELKVLLVIGIFVIQQISSKFAGFIANLFNYNTIDKDCVFAWISVHHIIQLLVGLVIIIFLSRKLNLDFNLKIGSIKIGVKYILIFSSIMFIYVILTYISGYYFNKIAPYNNKLNTKNIICTLGFQFF